jgi:hypothetical protein
MFDQPVEVKAAGKVQIRLYATSGLAMEGTPTPHALIALGENGIGVNSRTFLADGTAGDILLGGNGSNGDLLLFPSGATGIAGISSSAKATLLLKGGTRKIHLRNANGNDSIILDGNTGDILLHNADCAEEFDMSLASTEIEPGTVMVLDNDGMLEPSSRPYDKRVAGVISGAGGYKPGIVLDRKHSPNKRVSLALLGKVFCKVDAQYSQIRVGDMLTTSPTVGHAMRARDRSKAFGSIIGKAMRGTRTGKSLIPILIALQ